MQKHPRSKGSAFIMISQKQKLEERFQSWLQEKVFIDTGDSQIWSRAATLRYFVREGLVPFLRDFGYCFHDIDTVENDMANFLFSRKDVKIPEHRNHPLDRNLYDYLLGYDEWEQFWEAWRGFGDFADDAPESHEIRSMMPEFVWARLCLELSPASEEVDFELGFETAEVSHPNGDDVTPALDTNIYRKDPNSLY